ncbi:MAG: RHS repeat-associated core domain-containing protein [Jatrophihabitantaceae bacterium]
MRAGVNGVLFSLQSLAAGSRPIDSRNVQFSVDYSAFADAGGAGFGKRQRLVQLPACALSTPALAGCRRQLPLASINDPVRQSVRTSAPVSSHAGAPMVLAAVAAASSSNGDFSASSLAPSGSWSQGGSSGGFNYSYPVSVPTPATGPAVAPVVGLTYSSAGVDGQIASTNNQSGWVGEGWDYNPGYIERTYRTCSDSTTAGSPSDTGDKCWAGNVLTMNLGGSTTALVRDDATGAWHPQDDDGQLVQLLTGTSNGANNGEYWKITTTDGTSYMFGRGVLPGGTAANQTNSVLTEPVYYQNSTDSTCYSATFANSKCATNLAWRWNLDYVIDGSGNVSAYYYDKESNYYGAAGGATAVPYDRAAVLNHIDYGMRKVNESVYGRPATNRVRFTSTERCMPDANFSCLPADFTAANASHWPDTPQDQQCGAPPASCANHAPTFWSRLRLTTIETSYYTGSTYQPVDTYSLGQSFPATGDEQLELDSVSRIGHSGSVASTPLTTNFTSQLLPNRVPGSGSQSDMYFWRLSQIQGETGLTTLVSYGQPNGQGCTATTLPADPANNLQLCFPVKWTPQAHTQPILDYFQKYLVTQVEVIPQDGRSVRQITDYDYLGTPAWHADDNEVVKASERTYGQFRGYAKLATRFGDTGNMANGLYDQQSSTVITYYRGLGGSIGDSIAGESAADNDEYAGQVHESQTFNGVGGPEVSTTIYDLATISTTATRARTGLPALTARIAVTAKTREITDAPGISSTARRTATSVFSFDALGQQVQQTDSTDDGTPSTCTTTTYATPNTGNAIYVRNRVAEVIVSQQVCPALGTAPTPVLTDVRTYYDGATTAGVPGAGLPTQVDTRLDGTSTPYFGKVKASFDTAGRQLSTTQFLNAADTIGRTTRTAYTPSLPATASTTEVTPGPLTKTVATNAKSQTVTALFDPARGVATRVVDVAGHQTDAEYDALGRLTGVWKPGQVRGVNLATSTVSYLVAGSGPSSITTRTLVDTGSSIGYATSVALLDSFGNQVQSQSDAPGGYRVVTDSYLDSHGWVVNTHNRWVLAGAPTTSLVNTGDDGVDDRTQTRYDGAGRATLTTEYKGLTATSSVRVVHGGNQVTVIPPAGGVAQTSMTNARGWTTMLRQYTSAPTVTGSVVTGAHQDTSYGYTALGQQSSISSASGTLGFSYDRGGRITSQSDPDTGTSLKTYSDAGEVLRSTDANNVVLSHTYDALGRRTGTYHTATQTTANLLDDWVWDTVQPGRLSYSQHHVSSTAVWKVATTGYDGAGLPLSTTTTLPTGTAAEAAFAAAYTTNFTYTSTHQLATMQPAAPAGNLPSETLRYTYDSLGNPASLSGISAIVSAATYSPYGEPLQYQLGVNNQLSSLSYDYDAQTRRLSMQDLSTTAVQAQLEHRTFGYDVSGNLIKSTDTEGNASAPVQTQCYRYTALNQLSQAWSATDGCASDPSTAGVGNSLVGGPQPYWSSWSFTAAGLRSQQVQHAVTGAATGDRTTGYTYDLAGHANGLHTTSGSFVSSYQEDAAGNVTARTATGANLAMTYDYQNRTLTMSGAGGSSNYVYDSDGNELLRHDATTATLYLPGQELLRTNSTGTITGNRYYLFNGTEVAMRGSATSANPYWVMVDPHGSAQVAAATVATGIGPVVRRYVDPFGNQLGVTSGGTWPDSHMFLNKPSVPTTASSSLTAISDVGARKYDPTTGRFLSADPVVDGSNPQSLNGYAYADNNPIGKADPSGLRVDDPSSNRCDSACSHGVVSSDPRTYGKDPSTAGTGAAAHRGTCLYITGNPCSSPGIKLAEAAKKRGMDEWLEFHHQLEKSLDPCHLDDRCQAQDTLATITGVKGCFKQHKSLECAGFIPFGKAIKGGAVFWTGSKWVYRSAHGVRKVDGLRHVQEVADKIAAGHAGSKHYAGLAQADLAAIVRDAIENYDDLKPLRDNRFAFWRGGLQEGSGGTIVIFNPNDLKDYGTVFVPDKGYAYFRSLPRFPPDK